jgi:Domain of unknown function (DUF4190)
MVMGILSMPTCCCWFASTPVAVAALVLGIISLGKIRQNPQMWTGGAMAIAGIVTSSIGLILAVLAMFTTIDDNLRSQLGGRF